jgi:hypothetical protein
MFPLQTKDRRMATLLNLSLKEYEELKHYPLYPFWDKASGKVLEYYIYIKPSNHPDLLKKLKVDSSNFIRFKPEFVLSRLAPGHN